MDCGVTNSDARDDAGPKLCSDGTGGVIVAWYTDDFAGKSVQSFAQRYNSSGVAQWAAGGVQVCTAAGFRGDNAIVSDGSNGVILFFIDTRNDAHGLDYDYLNNNDLENPDIYAQRLNGSGSRQWTNNGVAVVTAAGTQQGIGTAIADGSGGAIFIFDDGRNDPGDFSNIDVFAQRVNSSGTTLWAANGVAFSTADGNQQLTTAVSDGAGGVVAAFKLENSQLFVKRITGAGQASWTAGGVAISQPADNVMVAEIGNDGFGNFVIAYDLNNSDGATIRAQKINPAGVVSWGAGGTIVNNTGYPYNSRLTTSNNGSVIVSWNNSINGSSSQDAYASKILGTGVLVGSVVSNYISAADGNWNNPATWVGGVVPPTGAAVTIRHMVSCNVNASCATLTVEQPAGNLIVLTGSNITVTK